MWHCHRASKKSRIDYPPVKFYYRSEKQYLAGIQEYSIDGVAIRIYDKEKTITDCFMYRKQIGTDIALEALKDYMRHPPRNIHLLMEYAKIDRVEKLIQPYIEMLI